MAMSSPASTRVILGAMAALFLFFLLLPSSSTPSTTPSTTTTTSSSSSGSHSGHGAHVEPKPEPDLLHTPCANDCHGHGRCFMARCFCAPGYGSNWNCQSKWSEPVPECFLHNNVQDWNPPGLYADLCYEHPDYGIAIIPKSRWQQAQDRESGLWQSSGGSHDRADQHASFFGNYASLPEDLGDLLEVGCGPYTQSKWIIDNGSKKFQTKSITLQDPGIDTYISSVSTCTFKDGFLSGRKVKTINAGTEELRGKSGNVQYDTIVMINVLEHVWNVFEVLENVHDALKTGGILVFNTRVLYVGTTRWPFEIYHPIRLKTEFLDFYYSNYKVLERKDVTVHGWIESYAILQKIK